MLDTTEALLLGSRDQLAVAHKRRGGIGVEGIETEDDHPIGYALMRRHSCINRRTSA